MDGVLRIGEADPSGGSAEQLIDRESGHSEHEMSHDFAGAFDVDGAASELIFQVPV